MIEIKICSKCGARYVVDHAKYLLRKHSPSAKYESACVVGFKKEEDQIPEAYGKGEKKES